MVLNTLGGLSAALVVAAGVLAAAAHATATAAAAAGLTAAAAHAAAFFGFPPRHTLCLLVESGPWGFVRRGNAKTWR
jgi:hypothetical protein